MNKSKVLIFGSNGLVGSSLNKILNKSEKTNNVFPSTRKDTDLENILHIRNTIKETEPDIIVNCAAKVGGILANNTYRSDFLIQNLKINLNLLEVLKDFNNIRLINLGSSCIYPLNAVNPINEVSFLDGKLEPTNSPYAIAKIAGIELGKEISNEFGNKIINLMPTNLYGPNDNFSELDSHVIPGLIHRMAIAKQSGDEIFKIWGTGNPLREFMYVDDLSYAVEFLLDVETENDLINVGSGEEISINDLSVLIKKIVNFEGSIENDLSKPDGNPRKLLDSSLLNSMGWSSKIGLEEGILKTFEWYQNNIMN